MALARSGGSRAPLCGRDRNEADRCCVSRPIFWNSRSRGIFGDAERKSELSQGRLDSGLDSHLPESMVIALFAVLLAGLISPLGQPSTPLPEVHASPGIAQLLSAAPTFYGSPRLAYTCIAVGLLSYAAVAVIRGFREPRSRRSWDGLAAASAAGGASYFLWVVIGPYL